MKAHSVQTETNNWPASLKCQRDSAHTSLGKAVRSATWLAVLSHAPFPCMQAHSPYTDGTPAVAWAPGWKSQPLDW